MNRSPFEAVSAEHFLVRQAAKLPQDRSWRCGALGLVLLIGATACGGADDAKETSRSVPAPSTAPVSITTETAASATTAPPTTGTVATSSTAAAQSPSQPLPPESTTSAESVPSTSAAVLPPASTEPSESTLPTAAPEPGPYAFPVAADGEASYARDHHDYPAADIFATCGAQYIAPTSGTISEVSLTDVWDADVNDPATRGGLSITLVGSDGVRYYGSHFETIFDAVRPGLAVEAGQPLGTVGETGNAKGTGCHVHFGISRACGVGDWEVRRGEYWPWPYLDSWRDGVQMSPVAEVPKAPC